MNLEGYKVCSIYPRFDFFILALDHVINHLDKFDEMSKGQYKPKQIFRVCVGSNFPMMPGCQHNNDYTSSLEKMVTNIDIIKLNKAVCAYIFNFWDVCAGDKVIASNIEKPTLDKTRYLCWGSKITPGI